MNILLAFILGAAFSHQVDVSAQQIETAQRQHLAAAHRTIPAQTNFTECDSSEPCDLVQADVRADKIELKR